MTHTLVHPKGALVGLSFAKPQTLADQCLLSSPHAVSLPPPQCCFCCRCSAPKGGTGLAVLCSLGSDKS